MSHVEVDPDAIPEELKARDQWLLWDKSNDTPRQPHWDGDFYISWSDPADWHSFEEAVEAAESVDSWGIGYVMAVDNDDHARGLYGVLDIDGCAEGEHGKPKEWVPSLDTFGDHDAYIEWSPSGTGLHIPIVGVEKPDWWADQHFTDDEHEGVELLTNKFCTFTGDDLQGVGSDVVEWSDDVEHWLIEAYKAVTGEDPTKSKSADFEDASDGGRGNREEFLSDDDIRDALGCIDPDVEYNTWRDIGFALADFFSSDHTAASLFKEWSRGGSKWDSDAEAQAERIISDASSGGGRTIGTVVHLARQNGWTMPTPGTGSTDPATDPPAQDIDEEEVRRGEQILESQYSPEAPPRELEHRNGCYGYEKVYKDSDGNVTNTVFDTVCNFTLETVSVLKTDAGNEFRVAVHPQSAMEDSYEVRVDPTVFNSQQTFKEEVVCGRTTWFDTNNRKGVPTQTILRHLRELVSQQPAPIRSGTEFIGLAPSREEWVTPFGSIGTDGWVENPDYEFYAKAGEDDQSGSLSQKWSLRPEDGTDFDVDEVRRICELLPQTRKLDRGLPILGWFYAAPLRPLIHSEFGEGAFNLLQVYGDSGAGKTTTLESFWKAFGGGSDPYGANDTSFTIEKHMTESCGLPVWYDEYKPAEMPKGDLDRLRRALKKVTKGATLPKGTADMGEIAFELRAPVVVSGEQKFQDPPIRRRAIMTNLTSEATEPGSSTVQAFGELTGASYEDGNGEQHFPEGCELEDHARAYYTYVISQDTEELERVWIQAREQSEAFLDELDVQLDGDEQRGIQTIAFGVELYRQFAASVGVDSAVMPSDEDVLEAVDHVVSNIGKDGSRREHADDFMELLTLAATEDYIEAGVHYRAMESRKHEQEVLAIHMPSAFTAVKKYVREYNLEDEYTILSKGDYLTSFGNKAEQDGTYVFATNKRTRKIANGSKAVHFDPWRTEEKLGGDFQFAAFTNITDSDGEEETESDDDGPDGTPITELKPGYQDIVVEVASTVEPKPWLQAEGTLSDGSGIIDYVARGGSNVAADFEEGAEYYITDARVTKGDEGMPTVEIRDGVTEISELSSSTQSGLPEHADDGATDSAATDGGKGLPQDERVAAVRKAVTAKQGAGDRAAPIGTVVEAAVENGADRERARETIDDLLQSGELYEPKDGEVETT